MDKQLTDKQPTDKQTQVRRPDESEDVTNKRRAKVFQDQLVAHRPHRSGDDEPKAERGVENDALGCELAQDFLIGAETGRHAAGEMSDTVTIEEQGGPFTLTSGATEFGGDDESNPPGTEPAPFPSPNRAD